MCQFFKRDHEVYWLGPPEAGKSYLCQAIGYRAFNAEYTVRYRFVFYVPRNFLHEEVFNGQNKVLAKYLASDLLIIADMGVKTLPKGANEYPIEIIMQRSETKSAMMTSNRPLKDWGKLMGDVLSVISIMNDSYIIPR